MNIYEHLWSFPNISGQFRALVVIYGPNTPSSDQFHWIVCFFKKIW